MVHAFRVVGRGWKNRKKRKTLMGCYQVRNERISELGYEGYQSYLKSDDWKFIRYEVLKAYPFCITCLVPATQVHHLSYATVVLLGIERRLLVSICDACHEGIEFGPDGKKQGLAQANEALFAKVLSSQWRGGGRWIKHMSELIPYATEIDQIGIEQATERHVQKKKQAEQFRRGDIRRRLKRENAAKRE